MTPNSIGLMWGNSQSGAGIVFGKHSGCNAFDTRLHKLGYNLDISKLNTIFARFRKVANKKKGRLDDDNLESLVSKQAGVHQWPLNHGTAGHHWTIGYTHHYHQDDGTGRR
jgi:2-isopropylmalate synthase